MIANCSGQLGAKHWHLALAKRYAEHSIRGTAVASDCRQLVVNKQLGADNARFVILISIAGILSLPIAFLFSRKFDRRAEHNRPNYRRLSAAE